MGSEDKSAFKPNENHCIKVVSVSNADCQKTDCPGSAALEEPHCATARKATTPPILWPQFFFFNPNSSTDSSFRYVQLQRYTSTLSLQGVALPFLNDNPSLLSSAGRFLHQDVHALVQPANSCPEKRLLPFAPHEPPWLCFDKEMRSAHKSSSAGRRQKVLTSRNRATLRGAEKVPGSPEQVNLERIRITTRTPWNESERQSAVLRSLPSVWSHFQMCESVCECVKCVKVPASLRPEIALQPLPIHRLSHDPFQY